MSKYVCKTKCFFRGRTWGVGEKLTPQGGEELPKHFVELSDNRLVNKAKIEPEAPITLSAMTKKIVEEEAKLLPREKPDRGEEEGDPEVIKVPEELIDKDIKEPKKEKKTKKVTKKKKKSSLLD